MSRAATAYVPSPAMPMTWPKVWDRPLPSPTSSRRGVALETRREHRATTLGLLVDAAGTSAVDPIREVSELARGSAHVTVGMGWVAPSPMSSTPPDHRYGMDRPVSPEMPAGMGSAAGEIGVLPPKRAGPLTAPIAPVTVAAVIHRSEPAAEPIGQGIPYRRSCGPIPAVTQSHTRGHICRSPLYTSSIGSNCRVFFIVSEGSKEPGNQIYGSHTDSQQFIPYQRSGFDLQTETPPCTSTETR